ncbi:uncharacterized protein KQ657_003400 [Scheffersomyces spartinae]|uniref:Uncharacterized protein n=1 Tax=Scheffersomyces spartinae TaxID=45513 RepID=A0A9P8AKA2_9ASCO|nr:uncharacterized protein KQ657_003400 [Scheffersomyces spartinae]KAG7195633.1 hypothetical protein KQ657_003400 [Scheffersomyces spartinae]
MSNRSSSYRYVQLFVEKQIKHLKEDVVSLEQLQALVNEGVITEKVAIKIQRKLNEYIRREVTARYRAQEKHLVVEQVCKLEHEHALLASTQLAEAENALGPLSLPDFDRVAVDADIIQEFANIVDELPKREYLQTASTIEYTDVLNRYEQLRDDLVALRDLWLYKTEKLEYLRNLRRAIRASLDYGDDLGGSEGASNYLYDSNEDMSDNEPAEVRTREEIQSEIHQFESLIQSKIYQRK